VFDQCNLAQSFDGNEIVVNEAVNGTQSFLWQ